MDEGLEEITEEDVAQSVSYALKRERKAIGKLESCDDGGHFRIARRLVEHLRLCGYRFFRHPIDWRGRYPPSSTGDDRDDSGT